jgi:hypothetical protein
VRLEYLALGGGFRGSRLIHLSENKLAINISVHTTLVQHLVLEEMIDYIFNSFRSE